MISCSTSSNNCLLLTGDIIVFMSETHSEIRKGLKTIIRRLPTHFAIYIYVLSFLRSKGQIMKFQVILYHNYHFPWIISALNPEKTLSIFHWFLLHEFCSTCNMPEMNMSRRLRTYWLSQKINMIVNILLSTPLRAFQG